MKVSWRDMLHCDESLMHQFLFLASPSRAFHFLCKLCRVYPCWKISDLVHAGDFFY